jgi:hypothetical protein
MYEYDVREFHGDTASIINWLNENGREGWEAFAMESTGAGHRVWLKRQRSGVAGGLATGGDGEVMRRA